MVVAAVVAWVAAAVVAVAWVGVLPMVVAVAETEIAKNELVLAVVWTWWRWRRVVVSEQKTRMPPPGEPEEGGDKVPKESFEHPVEDEEDQYVTKKKKPTPHFVLCVTCPLLPLFSLFCCAIQSAANHQPPITAARMKVKKEVQNLLYVIWYI